MEKVHAQGTSLGDPIINITFGAGSNKYAGPLDPDVGRTSYSYDGISPNDNAYTIVNTSAQTNGGWITTNDHTGNSGGYFMIVNASYNPGTFFTKSINALCSSTTYQFAAWIKNIIREPGKILPNVTFSIETASGVVLNSGNTGDIREGTGWIQYPFTFTTPNDSGPIILRMTNNAPGGVGNDIAIDDITFRPEGAAVTVAFGGSSTSYTSCKGATPTLTIKASSNLPIGYLQKPQQRINGVWRDLDIASTASSFNIQVPDSVGGYRYRLVSGQAGTIDSSRCVVASNELNVSVVPLPIPKIQVIHTGCVDSEVQFTDPEFTTGDKFLWNFGDGYTDTVRSPKHSYAIAKDYIVKLTVTNGYGCQGATLLDTVHISAPPVAAFSYSAPNCAKQVVTFTDLSTTPESEISSWYWDFDDGTKQIYHIKQPFLHTFSSSGTYNVKLIISTNFGCSDTLTKSVVIHPTPQVSFTAPPSCISDMVRFTNTSTIADGTENQFTYLWDYGDGSPKQIIKDGAHQYSLAGEYDVTLIVTSSNNCSDTTIQRFKVNGAKPVANFEVLNKNTLCGDREVFIKNTSTVLDGGDVTRIELYYEYLGNLTLMERDDNPNPNKLYSYQFPEFHSGSPREYKITMVAYSGTICVSAAKTDIISLLPTPVLEFNLPVTEICENADILTLTSRDISGSGINGIPFYSGPGVNAIGTFNPAMVGIGPVKIQCIYIYNGTGCADTIIREIIVKPAPIVNAGDDITVLEGGTAQLKAVASGTSLKYSWTPSTGLSNPDIANPIVTGGPVDIIYKVTVSNDQTCSAEDEVKVTSLKFPVIPNTFTPNGDGVNDVWEIKYLNTYPGCTIDIFNRYGQKVYSSLNYSTPWNGRTRNADLATGVYYYIIDPKHGRKPTTGYITIIR